MGTHGVKLIFSSFELVLVLLPSVLTVHFEPLREDLIIFPPVVAREKTCDSRRYSDWSASLILVQHLKVSHDKMGCTLPMVEVSLLPYTEFGPNGHREDAYHFSFARWN